jgi:murein L,D-transpeptidase YcbB/YkuD
MKRLALLIAFYALSNPMTYAADRLDLPPTWEETTSAIGQVFQSGPASLHAAHLPKPEWDALTTFYAQRNFAPIWTGDIRQEPKRSSLIERLVRADEDGLNSADYPVQISGREQDAALAGAESDILLSASAVAYARDARGARINLSNLSKLITPKLDLPDAASILSSLMASANPSDTLQAYNPPQAGYKVLRAKLAELRETTASIGEISPLPSSQTAQKPIRTSTAMVADEPVTPFDLITNMERWRWVERDLGDRYIEVNLPEFMLHVIDHGAIIHTTRTVVGKPDTPTPLFSEKMQYLIVNPSWSVPASIVRKEFLPKLAEDPDFAAKAGYEVTQNGDLVTIRQPPGERNALGLVKFIFPNQHAVYLHDTPMRKLFANVERAYSHGCVRVEDPFSLASVILDDPKYSTDDLKALIGKGERVIRLKRPLPVQLTYFTLVQGADGLLHHVGDIYGYDRAVEAALGLGQSRSYASLAK